MGCQTGFFFRSKSDTLETTRVSTILLGLVTIVEGLVGPAKAFRLAEAWSFRAWPWSQADARKSKDDEQEVE